MTRDLTLLQRAIIHQLREAGLLELSDQARDCWSRGERSPLTCASVDRSGDDQAVPDLLRDIFERANAHAARPSRL